MVNGAPIARSAGCLAGCRILRGLARRLLARSLLRDLLRRFLRGLLRRLLRGFLRGLLRGRLFRYGLLRRVPAEPAAHRLAGLLQQLRHFLQGQRLRVAILGDAAVELAVADVRTVAAIGHLDVAALELLDDAVARELFL